MCIWCKRRNKQMNYNSILAILTDCVVQRTVGPGQTVTVVMILQTVQYSGAECWETVTGLNWLQMVQCVGAEFWGTVTGLNWLQMVVCWCGMLRYCYSLTGCKWYSVVVRNVEGPLLDLTGCPCCGKRVNRVVFSVECLVSKLRYLTMDCDVELCFCFSGKNL